MYVSPISARLAAGRSTPARRAIVPPYPCLCLCFGLTQMTRTTPSRWTNLHLSQIFLTDARTFIMLSDLLYDPSPREVVFRELDFHTVARQQPDPIPLRGARPGGQHPRLVTQLQPVQQAGQL